MEGEDMGEGEDIEEVGEDMGEGEDIEEVGEDMGEGEDIEEVGEDMGEGEDIEEVGEDMGEGEDIEEVGEDMGEREDLEKEDVQQLFSKLSDICKLLKQKGEEVVVLRSKDKHVTKQDMLTKFKQFCEDQQNIQPLKTTSRIDNSDVGTNKDSPTGTNKQNTDQLQHQYEEEESPIDDHTEVFESDVVNSIEDSSLLNDGILNDTKPLKGHDRQSKRVCKSKSDESKLPITRSRHSTRNKIRMNYKSFTKEEEICVSKKTKLEKNDEKLETNLLKNDEKINSLGKNKGTKTGIKLKIEPKNIHPEKNLLTDTQQEHVESKINSNDDEFILKEGKEIENESIKIKKEKDIENEEKCDICGTTFIHKEHLRIHLLKIPDCNTFLKQVDSLQDENLETFHIKYTDKNTNEAISTPITKLLASQLKMPFKCIVCGKLFSKRSNFKRHLFVHSDHLPPACNICGTKFKNRENALKHRKDHDNNPFHCQLCNKHRFKTAEELEDHKNNCSRPKYSVEDLTCDVCGHISKCRAALLIHQNVHLGVRPYSCEHCGKKMSSNASLERHIMSMHQELTPFKCEICDKAFKVKDNYRKHMKNHEEPQYKCEICGKTCTESGNLKKHMMTHTKEKPFVCELCGKKYSRKALLDNHRRLHTGEKPYECKEKNCGKTFRSYANLKQHTRNHSTDRPFVCDVCGKAFKQPGRMAHHRKSHFLEYRWNCLFCTEKFKTIFKYKGHVAKEHPLQKAELESKTSIRLHKCDLCGKVYGEKEDLKRHIYIHKGLKPFKCVHCFKGFNDKSNLKQHMKIHSNEHEFTCEICRETFSLKRDLRMHMCTDHDQLIPGDEYTIPVKASRYRQKVVRARPVLAKLDDVIPTLNPIVTTTTQNNSKQTHSIKGESITTNIEMELTENDVEPVTKETHVIVQKEPNANNFVLAPAQLQLFKAGDYMDRKEIQEQTNTGPRETVSAHYQMAPQQTLVSIGSMMAVEVGLVQSCFYVEK